ncbi:MAG: biotin/lipoyl-binding protein, partial [Acidobacteriales bacterium]
MKKRIIPALVVVALVAAGVVYLVRRWNGGGENRLAFSGNIELTEVKLSFKTTGRMVELLVREGDAVKKGAVIARLDRDQLLSQRDAQRATLAAAQSVLTQLLTSVDYQREALEGGQAASKADLNQAEARLRDLLAGSRPQEIQQARAAVEAARADQVRAASDWQRAQTLYKNDDISTSQHDQFRMQSERASAVLQQA